ncbi:MAG TPA: hypothetical protein VK059_06710 [Nocardioidaceae bacterium]|nr:hypothetical protein [Nocardioidaceae bacterium]
MTDAAFADPRLAALYDPLDPDRSDLDVYAAIVEELGAPSIVDRSRSPFASRVSSSTTYATRPIARGRELVFIASS